MSETRKTFTADEARTLGEEIGIDWATAPFDVEQFRAGMDVELEHGLHDLLTNVTDDDPHVTAKIALAGVHEGRDRPGWGTTGDILFVSAGGYHHHLDFNTWKSAGGPPQPDGVAGLHHVALNFSSREQLAEAVGRLVDAGVPLRGLTDHGTHLAVYLSDPDGNDLELAWDRPFDEWRRYGSDDAPPNDGRLDLDELLSYRG